MRSPSNILLLFVLLLTSSCARFETTEKEAKDSLSWVPEAKESFRKSKNETEQRLVKLRDASTGVDPFAENENWTLYRIEGEVYGVRTRGGIVTGELIAGDAEIVGPWIRASGEIRTSGEGFKSLVYPSEDHIDLQ